MLIRGIPAEFPEDVVESVRAIAGPSCCASREDWTASDAVAIDDRETIEVDDALTVVESDGETLVGVHIADVAAFVDKGSAVDREALRRTATVYLPNVLVPMFPLLLSADLASLVGGQDRPALTVVARFDVHDNLLGSRFARTMVRVGRRLTYTEADLAIEAGDPVLGTLQRIAGRLLDARTGAGAQVHRRPEVKVHVRDGRIDVECIASDTPSRMMVAEMMILANRLTADRATADLTPVIYRIQDAPDSEPPDTEGLPEALRFEMLRKAFKRSHLSLSPAPHAGLGLGAYTQISSPIRRYADLVTQRQFAAAMEGRPLPYDNDELLRVISAAEAREVEIRQVEQISTTYWILRYLEEKVGAVLPAILLDRKGHVELSDYLVRGKIPASDQRRPGDIIPVVVESVRPVRGEIQLRVDP
jgi:exoribonuclease-2